MLLILATVAISMAVDSNGLFARARKAAEDWNKSVGDESSAIENAMLIMNQIYGGSTSGGGTELPPVEEKVEVQSVTLNTQSIIIEVGGSEKITATVLPESATNKEVKWSSQSDGIARVEDGTVTGVSKGNTIITATAGEQSAKCNVKVIELLEGWDKTKVADVVEEGERKAPIPKGYVASSVEGEDTIENGLVIYEEGTEAEKKGPVTSENHATALTGRNQYVWIPVDDINYMVMCQDCGAAGTLTFNANDNTLQCNNSTTHGNATKLAGKLYATSTGENFNAGLEGQTYTQGSGIREPDTLSSYDGSNSFELVPFQTAFDEMAKSVAKYKGFYISRYEIQKDETNGIASKKGATVLYNDSASNNWYGLYTMIQNATTPDSTVAQMIWGSQYDQVMKFVDGKNGYKVTEPNDARHDSSGYKTSGNNPNDITCNIYDLEGNYYEWTAEASNTSSRAPRGR